METLSSLLQYLFESWVSVPSFNLRFQLLLGRFLQGKSEHSGLIIKFCRFY